MKARLLEPGLRPAQELHLARVPEWSPDLVLEQAPDLALEKEQA
jgi:hypothetical protein